jgi:4-hydroxybenzoate polyprenyltransferase/phosphoserine phosphatase
MQDKSGQQSYSVLVIDVDGTLIRTDLLHESVFALLKLSPFYVFMLPLWLLQGKAHLKQMIANRVNLLAELLPYREEFVDYLREEHASGRKLMLATASNIRYAQGIAEHLGLFSWVLGSTERENLSGSCKLAHIRSQLGSENFAYAGNGSVDLPIWEAAGTAVLVNTPKAVQAHAEKISKVARVFDGSENYLKAFGKAMRPHQWLKNLLIFVPLVLSQHLDEIQPAHQAFLGFLAFCLCASSVYLLNDLLDLSADRQHPTKCFRPFAAGDLPIVYGVIGMAGLLLCSFLVAMLLPPYFMAVLITYYFCTIMYSVWLKSSMLIDALMLAALYTLRLIAGAAAITVPLSFWLLAFSMFIFLSLAFIKRYSELLLLANEGRQQLLGRAYQAVDMETLAQFGTASGYLAVLVMAFYINSDNVFEGYTRPEALWLLCPMMLYWISRMWVVTRRGEMHDDPIVYTIKDRRTYTLGAMAGVALLVATYWPVIREFIPDYFLTS